MTESLGSLCIVLHGHLPYVLHHGGYPHGESWLYEAAAETYLPLLSLLDEAAVNGVNPQLTLGLTPVLLEQLAHERFKAGFVSYLLDRLDRARQDRREFEGLGEPHFARLAARWEAYYARAAEHFERIGRNIAGPFAAHGREGRLQLLTSNATHAYMPLLLTDPAIRAQMLCGVSTSQRHFGFRPRGMWLPECAYRPGSEDWTPSVLYHDSRPRPGLEQFISEAGVTHFFVDAHLLADAQPLGVVEGGRLRTITEESLHWDSRRGWRSPLEPVGIASGSAQWPACYAMGRHPRVSEQVWSRVVGYPGAGEYLEFHRKHREGGLRYHRVTNHHTSLGEKQQYDPAAVVGRVYEQARHFCDVVRETLSEHRERTGRAGVVVAPFDAELFGHWWFEGPQFLRDVIFTLAHDPAVTLTTAESALHQEPPDKVVRLPEGSWGENGNHSVWMNDNNRWMWEMEYRAEVRLLNHLRELPWRTDDAVRHMLERAGRELLLLQASDWPFVIHSRGAIDYGVQRFAGHCTRFDRMTHLAEQAARHIPPGPVERVQVEETDLHDSIFPMIDLNWWTG